MKRAVRLNPNLAKGKNIKSLSVIRHAVGLRSYRAQGAGGALLWAWGFGNQGSWACSGDVVKLVEEVFDESGEVRAKL